MIWKLNYFNGMNDWHWKNTCDGATERMDAEEAASFVDFFFGEPLLHSTGLT